MDKSGYLKERGFWKKDPEQPIIQFPFVIRVHPEYHCPEFIRTVMDSPRLLRNPDTQILLEGRNRVGVVDIPIGGKTHRIVIKEFRIQGIDRWKSCFFHSKAYKAWRGSNWLIESEIETPFPVACLEKRNRFFLEQGVFLSKMIEGVEEIRSLLRDLPDAKLKGLLHELASFLWAFHSKGFLHRDLSDGNVLLKKETTDRYVFYLVDTNRIKKKRAMKAWTRIKNLIRLGVPLSYQRFFLEQYFRTESVGRTTWLWYRINKDMYVCFLELKKRLRLKKIAQRLKIQ